jgi:hypothetical protein
VRDASVGWEVDQLQSMSSYIKAVWKLMSEEEQQSYSLPIDRESSALPTAESNSTDWYRPRLLLFTASLCLSATIAPLLSRSAAAPVKSACIDLIIPVTVNAEINVPSFAPLGDSSRRRRLTCSSRRRGTQRSIICPTSGHVINLHYNSTRGTRCAWFRNVER